MMTLGYKSLVVFFAFAIGVQAARVTSFNFLFEDIGWEKEGNYWEGDIDEDAKTITFTTQKWIENIDKLAAIFELDENVAVMVGSELQVSGITQNDFRRDVVYTIGDNEYKIKFVSPQATGLPVIRIDTDNAAPIISKEDWVTMTFSMTDPNNPEKDIASISNQQIRGRGNSTWNYPKKPYRIKFRKNQLQSPFGLPAARNWVLLLDNDKTIFGFELGRRLGLEFTCSYHNVELYLNGYYIGSYLFTEHRQADPEMQGVPGRPKVDLDDGWFVQIDRHYDESPKFKTTNYKLPIMIHTPEADTNSNNPVYDFVKNDWNELADSMASVNFPQNGYINLIDIESFVKYFLVQTIILNTELHHPIENPSNLGSVFFYKDKDGKISAGPLWDLDWSFGAGWNIFANSYPYQINPFLSRFLQDPVFLVRYKEIWNDNFDGNISSMPEFIDGIADKIRKSINEDYKRWELTTDFDYRIEDIKIFFNTRIAFLNETYNKVEVLPASKNFGKAAYGYSETIPQTITLVAYGEITSLSAMLQNDEQSDFEIIQELAQDPTGNGGYLTTIGIKPKEELSLGAYADTLVLSGINQGNSFELKVPLTFVVEEPSTNIQLPQIASGPIRAYATSGAIVLKNAPNNAKIEVYNLSGQLIHRAKTLNGGIGIQTINVQPGMYIVKIGNQSLRIPVI